MDGLNETVQVALDHLVEHRDPEGIWESAMEGGSFPDQPGPLRNGVS